MISLENLFLAWQEFKKGKSNKADVQQFEFNLENNLFELHQELKSDTWQHSHYTAFNIRDPKLRRIHKSYFGVLKHYSGYKIKKEIIKISIDGSGLIN